MKAFVDEPGLGPVATGIKAIYDAMANGYVSKSGIPAIDQLFSRGGMASLLTTVWLVLGALSFAAILEHAGFLERLLLPIVAWARSRGRLILAVNASGIGLNIVAGDQYVADVLPSRMFRSEFEQRELAPEVLSRAVEDSGTVTSPLVPWNTCGAYMSGVLGVPTVSLPAVLLLQHSEPGARRAVRVHRLQGAVAARGERGGGASGRAGGDVTRAVAWIRARDPGFTALRRAARGAVVVPAMFAVGDKLIGNPTIALFAGFGSFALLLLVEFSGPMLDRVRSQVALVVAGAALVCLGSLASRSTWLATLAMAVAGFCVLFAGVVSSVFAAATVSMLLSFILAVSIRVPASAIPDRLAGWALAGAASLPAILFLWPAPVTDRLRDAAGAACRAHGRRLRAEAEYLARRHGRDACRA